MGLFQMYFQSNLVPRALRASHAEGPGDEVVFRAGGHF